MVAELNGLVPEGARAEQGAGGDAPQSGPPRAPSTQSDPTLFSKLKWLTFFRLILGMGLFGSTLLLQLRSEQEGVQVRLLYGLTILVFLLSALSAALLKQIKNLPRFGYLQLLFDTLLITPVIFLTGGLESIFSFLYFWVILSASYLLYTPGAFYAATLSGTGYGLLAMVEVQQVLPHFGDSPHIRQDLSYVFYNVTINLFAFFLVAFLASFLSEQLKKTRAELLSEQSTLRGLEKLHQEIVENISSGIVTFDLGGRIIFLNRSAEAITGQGRAALEGLSVESLFPGTLEALQEIHLDEDAILRLSRWERHFTRKDRQRLVLGIQSSPLKDPSGSRVGTILILEDLTRIRRLEEKARRDDRLKLMGRLAAGLAHEIRNPLASISGSIQVLESELDVRDENRALMQIVVRETDRLNALLTDFLQYVRPGPPVNRPVNLPVLVREVLESLRRHPHCAPGVELISDTLPRQHGEMQGVPTVPDVMGDPDQLRQVLWNLTLNAVEFMPGGGRLEIQVREVGGGSGEPPRVELRVLDTGPGFDPVHAERLFDPFFSTRTGGTGLGLALVEKIIQAHDGTVRARNRPEGGAVFEVSLPIVSPPPRGSSSGSSSPELEMETPDAVISSPF